MDVRSLLKQQSVILLDGATGTMLQRSGVLMPGVLPESLNLTNPGAIEAVHRAYLEAGSQIVYANTFGANGRKFSKAKSGTSVSEIVAAGVSIAKRAASDFPGSFVALDVGPLGELLEPAGTLHFEDAYDLFREIVEAGAKAGADVIVLETMTDLYEMKAALLAAKEGSSLPVIATMSFEQNGRTFSGCDVQSMALTLEGLGADSIGINCSLGPVEILPLICELKQYTNLPITVKPNAGLPTLINDETVFTITADAFCEGMEALVNEGVALIGGCCGTDPEFIRQMAERFRGKKVPLRPAAERSAVCSGSRAVSIRDIAIIGERINPTGKKRFQEALRCHDFDYILRQGVEQADAGAEILDVNVGLPGIDEPALMTAVVKRLQGILDLPLQIDSSDSSAIEAALRIVNGRAIVNSVNGEDAVLDRILPMVKHYGACVVGLTLDEKGIPKRAEDRFEIAKHILQRAQQHGIPKEDVIIDCLTLTAGAEQESAFETVRAVQMVHEQLGLKTALGVSNISFGLPQREVINLAFLSAALCAGLNLPILNPNVASMVDAVCAFRLLKNIDRNGAAYIDRMSGRTASSPAPAAPAQRDLTAAIVSGLRGDAVELTRSYCGSEPPLCVISERLIPALDVVGEKYERGEIFLPQLISAAEAAKGCFDVVREFLTEADNKQSGIVVIATVKGDIHDIGKNIVKVILQNYGFQVIDLGKDVPPEEVVRAVKESHASLAGLSALMTTTVKNMRATIELLRRDAPFCRVVVGGAVLTEEFAKEIGADFYAKDAQQTVAIAKAVYSGEL